MASAIAKRSPQFVKILRQIGHAKSDCWQVDASDRKRPQRGVGINTESRFSSDAPQPPHVAAEQTITTTLQSQQRKGCDRASRTRSGGSKFFRDHY
ncbi:hypothetical protein CA51_06190 [Rosistilla oblonga]|nr:hypothetical protein CA51_06190 [Rosistilla oblonga]